MPLIPYPSNSRRSLFLQLFGFVKMVSDIAQEINGLDFEMAYVESNLTDLKNGACGNIPKMENVTRIYDEQQTFNVSCTA